MPRSLVLPVTFLIQVVTGSVVFLGVYLVALVLAWVINQLNAAFNAAAWLATVGTVAEIALVVADMFAWALFLVVEVIKICRLVREEMQSGEA
jgi:hypothetical protein